MNRFGSGLLAMGLRMEDRVLIAMHDTTDWPVAFLGAIRAGIIPVAVNTLLTSKDYQYMLSDSRAKALIVSEALLPQFKPILDGLPFLKHVIVVGLFLQRRAGQRQPAARNPHRPRATTPASGSTPRARPACRRAPCTRTRA